jgi:hypothetical protein
LKVDTLPAYVTQSCHNFSHQVLGPSRLVHSITSRSNIVLQVHFALRILYNGLHDPHVFTDSARMPVLEELGSEQDSCGVDFHHLHKARQRVAHVVVVAEYLAAIQRPDILPDLLGIDANAVYEPLGVIVERDL